MILNAIFYKNLHAVVDLIFCFIRYKYNINKIWEELLENSKINI